MHGGVALFGGAFNPPHTAHEKIAKAALEQLPIDRLIVLPAGQHPWKDQNPDLAPAKERFELALLAFAFDPRIRVDDFELAQEGRSYTVETLRHFRASEPGTTRLYWLIGSDNLAEFHKWKDPKAILALATIVVYPRLGFPCDPTALAASELGPRERRLLLSHPLAVTPEATSSTSIRAALAAGTDVSTLLSPRVLARIRARHMYGT